MTRFLYKLYYHFSVQRYRRPVWAETKQSEIMDTSSEQQRTYEESERERESRKRKGKRKEVDTGKVWSGKVWNWKMESEKSEERKKEEEGLGDFCDFSCKIFGVSSRLMTYRKQVASQPGRSRSCNFVPRKSLPGSITLYRGVPFVVWTINLALFF